MAWSKRRTLGIALLVLMIPLASFSEQEQNSTAERQTGGAPSEQVQGLLSSLSLTKQGIKENEQKQRQVLGLLYDVNKQKKKISRKKGELTDQLLAIKTNVANLELVIKNLQIRADGQARRLQDRLKVLFTIGKAAPLELIFSIKNAEDLDRNLRFLKILADFDFELFKNYQENIAIIAKQKTELSRQSDKLGDIEKEIQVEEQKLKEQYEIKHRLLSSLALEKNKYLSKMSKLKSQVGTVGTLNSEKVEALLATMGDFSFYEQKKRLINPIDVPLTRGFGVIEHPKFKYVISHKGHFYESDLYTPVLATAKGRVAYTGGLDGFGQSIIIDHGDNYYSVYSNEIKSVVVKGDEIVRGQQIGSVAKGRFRATGLYFEIRHFSEPEDPREWLGTNSVQVSQTPVSHSIDSTNPSSPRGSP